MLAEQLSRHPWHACKAQVEVARDKDDPELGFASRLFGHVLRFGPPAWGIPLLASRLCRDDQTRLGSDWRGGRWVFRLQRGTCQTTARCRQPDVAWRRIGHPRAIIPSSSARPTVATLATVL